MGKKSAERRKHAETAKANGQALADEEGAVYRQNNRLWWAFSRRLGLWYGIIRFLDKYGIFLKIAELYMIRHYSV